MEIYVDGKWCGPESATVSVFDHGLLYGDGVFEGIRVYSRRIFRLQEHLDRLYDSARAIALEIPHTPSALGEIVAAAVRRNQQEDGYIRLVVTRGKGSLGIDPRSCPQPTVIVIATDVSLYPEEVRQRGLRVATVPTRQIAPDVFDARIKSLNYLKNVLAKLEAHAAGAEEAILLNAAGFIAECSADNLFIVRRGQLLTPSLEDGALAGITRAAILELARQQSIPCQETRLTRFDVLTADECFLTGTGAEVVSVREVDGRMIGHDGPGPLTRRLAAAFQERVHQEGDPVW